MAKLMKKAAAKAMKKQPAVIKKNGSKKYLEKVPDNMVFWCHDGQIFNNIEQLMAGLDQMSDDTFAYHANEDKNDFACWIMDVIGDEALAKDIKGARNKSEAKKAAQQRYAELTQWEG
jgi:hypothetical protein